MNWKATAALLVLAGLVGWLVLRGGSPEASTAPGRWVLPRTGAKPPPMEKIVVEAVGGRTEFVRGPGGRWLIARPVADRADQRILGELVGMLEALPKIETLPATAERIESTGLREPRVKVQITRTGEPPLTLQLGNTTPVEGRIYAQVVGADEIVVIPKELRDVAQRTPNSFRDARLTGGLAEKVVRVTIRNPRGVVELSRENGKWEIGGAGRGSAKIVDEWLEKLLGYSVRQFVGPDFGNVLGYGLAAPRASVRLEEESKTGEPIPPIEWSLGERTDPRLAGVYARIPERRSVVVLPLDAEEILTATADTFRERTLTALNLDFIDRVRLQPAGGTPLLLARRGEGWELREPRRFPAESREMEHLVRTLNGAAVEQFAVDAEQVARLLGDRPALRLVFAAYASETTAESGPGETPAVTLEFSAPQPQGLRLVRNVEEKVACWIKESVVQGLALQAAQWQSLALTGAADGELLEFEVRRAGEVQAFRFKATGGWQRAAGEGKLEPARVESAAALLGRLRAVRFLPEDGTDFGFAQPTLELRARFAGRADEMTLRLGSRTADGMWHAQVAGREGVTVLAEPDVRILRQLLPAP
ncbi:MAG: DUF4340 domain-containing protein [Verrucomicrobia bacterium]|nr:DUF4340 domain-containing protein [Verrucomicrobiota bacterium]